MLLEPLDTADRASSDSRLSPTWEEASARSARPLILVRSPLFRGRCSVHLSVFRERYDVHSKDKLRMHLGFRHEGKYGAFWITPAKEGFPAMALFINGEAGPAATKVLLLQGLPARSRRSSRSSGAS